MAFVQPKYTIEILDNTRTPITRVQSFHPWPQDGSFLRYTKKLSDYGTAKFRVGTQDPLFAQFGDILKPWANHVRIYRNQAVVFQGIIADVPTRSSRYIEVHANSYLFLLSKVLIRHDASTSANDGKDNYRALNSGTMATYVQQFITEGKTDSDILLSNVSVGTIENPQFPAGYKDTAGTALTGVWTFSSTFTIEFDYRDLLFCIAGLAVYGLCDFELTDAGVFNFKTRIGQDRPELMFEWGAYGAIEDYNAPLYGDRMANHLVGVAADYNNYIIHSYKDDMASQKVYGKLAGVAAYIDVKNENVLQTRLQEELKYISTPDAELHITLNDKAYPLGVWDVGDTVRIKVKDHAINVDQMRRIVAYEVDVNTNGKESIQLITNIPRT